MESNPIESIVVMGDKAVGKSALLVRFTSNTFITDCEPIIEERYQMKVNVDNDERTLDILDTADQEDFQSVCDRANRPIKGIILVYSVANIESFLTVKTLRQKILELQKTLNKSDKSTQKKTPIALVGNKCDLSNLREVKKDEGKKLAKEWGSLFFETSALKNTNVQKCFYELLREIKNGVTNQNPISMHYVSNHNGSIQSPDNTFQHSMDITSEYDLSESGVDAERPLVMRMAATNRSSIDLAEWTCSQCTYLNPNNLSNCEICLWPKPQGANSQDGGSSMWSCQRCTFLNHVSNSSCEICEYLRDPVSAHGNDAKVQISESGSPNHCSICLDEDPTIHVSSADINDSHKREGVAVLLPCQHWYCVECLEEYIKASFGSGELGEQLRCPMFNSGCNEVIGEKVAKVCAGQEMLDKLKELRERRQLERNPNARWCIVPDCGACTLHSPSSGRKVICKSCKNASCFRCRKKWHALGSCNFEEPSLDQWEQEQRQKGKVIKSCPKCRRLTERASGCLNITCVCGYRYCWVCLRPYPCPSACGQRVLNANEDENEIPANANRPRLLYTFRIAACFLAVIVSAIGTGVALGTYVIVVVLVLCCGPFFLLGSLCSKDIDNEQRRYVVMHGCQFVCGVVFLCIGIIFALVVLTFASIPGIIYLIYVIIMTPFCIDTGISHSFFGGENPEDQQSIGSWFHPEAPIYKDYKGPMPVKVIIVGKSGLAMFWLLLSFPTFLILSIALCPIAPLFLLPVCMFPDLPTNRCSKVLFFFLGTLAILGFLYGFQPAVIYQSILTTLFDKITWICAGLFLIHILCVLAPPTSDWAFMGFLWRGVLAPIAWLLGVPNPVNNEMNPFSGPVPFPGPYLLFVQNWNGHFTF